MADVVDNNDRLVARCVNIANLNLSCSSFCLSRTKSESIGWYIWNELLDISDITKAANDNGYITRLSCNIFAALNREIRSMVCDKQAIKESDLYRNADWHDKAGYCGSVIDNRIVAVEIG